MRDGERVRDYIWLDSTDKLTKAEKMVGQFDTVKGFTSGEDKIDLSSITTILGGDKVAIVATSFVKGGPISFANNTLSIDVNNDKSFDIVLKFENSTAVLPTDLVFYSELLP